MPESNQPKPPGNLDNLGAIPEGYYLVTDINNQQHVVKVEGELTPAEKKALEDGGAVPYDKPIGAVLTDSSVDVRNIIDGFVSASATNEEINSQIQRELDRQAKLLAREQAAIDLQRRKLMLERGSTNAVRDQQAVNAGYNADFVSSVRTAGQGLQDEQINNAATASIEDYQDSVAKLQAAREEAKRKIALELGNLVRI